MKLRLIALFWFFVFTVFARGADSDFAMLFSGVDQIRDYRIFVIVGITVDISFWVNNIYVVVSFFRSVVFLRNVVSTIILLVVFILNVITLAMALYANTIDNLDMHMHIDEERIITHIGLVVLFLYLSFSGYRKERRGEKFQWTLKELGKSSRKEDLS
ncbi:hypothetical protein [Roseibium sediminicola]|uniref:Uncharacterized protein n=1 Tax=Roseibium sediminicola TaxID=2933272 RepID=A0ABT0GVY2_9HYPH|nr:hypothetical protein [Roseibium sp. CAU 1639]MCK7613604.1 hypothetical protein [Roseibium sp. CAU 1639]